MCSSAHVSSWRMRDHSDDADDSNISAFSHVPVLVFTRSESGECVSLSLLSCYLTRLLSSRQGVKTIKHFSCDLHA